MKSINDRQIRSISSSLKGLLRTLGIENRVREYQVIVRWPDLVGNEIAKVTEAEKVADQILFIKVKNPVWRNELFFLKTQILDKINNEIGKDLIRDIKFF